MRIGPRHPRLGRAAYRLTLPLLEWFYARKEIHRSTSTFAAERFRALRAKLARGDTVYLGGICAVGTHNTGVALVEVTRERGTTLICNNEEERFSGERHTTKFPQLSLDALKAQMQRLGIEPAQIDGWMSGWDHAALGATVVRALMEEAPATFSLLSAGNSPMFHIRDAEQATRTARIIGRQLGLGQPAPVIATPHHDNHAWFSFAISPFARSERPVIVATLDMVGDHGAVSLYVCERGVMRKLYSNDSFFDSLGFYYAVISSTQGGWTMLSSEGLCVPENQILQYW
jgi:carbamoyltransferase